MRRLAFAYPKPFAKHLGRYFCTAGPPHGLGIDAVEQAWLSVPKPKHGSGLKHEAAVLHRLQMEYPAEVQAQEERMEGLTLMQVQLVKGLLAHGAGGERSALYLHPPPSSYYRLLPAPRSP